MKKSLILIPALLLFACDKIDQPLKPEYNFCEGCEADYEDNFVTAQNVLIEEFTGITCNNCPNAALETERIMDENPGRVFTIGIHASNFSVPDSSQGYTADFRTPEGTEIHKDANPLGVPSALINRIDNGTALYAKIQPQTWEGFVDNILSRGTAEVGMITEALYNDTTQEVCLTTRFRAEKDMTNRNLWWAAYLTENGIIEQQKMPDNSKNPNYEHKHVLRKSFNGTYGEALTGLELSGTISCSSRSLTLDPTWIAANCHVVVYVYDDDTKEILQVLETELE